MHDVQRVGGEDAVHLAHVPGRRRHVDRDRGAQVRRALVEDALAQGRHRVGQFRRLPDEARHREREVDRVLAGAAADLEHVRAAGERLLEDLEDRSLVAFAGFGVRKHGRYCAPRRRTSLARDHLPARRACQRRAMQREVQASDEQGEGGEAGDPLDAGPAGRRHRQPRAERAERRADDEAREVREDVGVLAAGAGEGEEREAREQGRGVAHPRRPVAHVAPPAVGRDEAERREHRGRGAEQVMRGRVQQRVDAVGEPGAGEDQEPGDAGPEQARRRDSRRARRTRGSTAGAACRRAA